MSARPSRTLRLLWVRVPNRRGFWWRSVGGGSPALCLVAGVDAGLGWCPVPHGRPEVLRVVAVDRVRWRFALDLPTAPAAPSI